MKKKKKKKFLGCLKNSEEISMRSMKSIYESNKLKKKYFFGKRRPFPCKRRPFPWKRRPFVGNGDLLEKKRLIKIIKKKKKKISLMSKK